MIIREPDPSAQVSPLRDSPARIQLEMDILGWQLRERERGAVELVRRHLQNYSFLEIRFEACHLCIQQTHDAGIPVTCSTIAALIAAGVKGMSEATAFEFLRQCMFGAPAVASAADLEAQIVAVVRVLREGRAADRQRQADDMLRRLGIEALNDASALIQQDVPATRFPLQRFDDIRLETDTADLIGGLIPQGCLIVVWGPPKCGKSFWTYDASMHVALGWEYRERRVIQGTVVYCAFEGGKGFKKRIDAFRKRSLTEHVGAVPFILLPLRIDLVKDHAQLIEDIRNQLRAWGVPSPVLIVLDTLNRSLLGSESSDEDMGGYIAAADAIREAFGCAVIIVHHCGVDDRRPRGHTSLPAAADVQIAVWREGESIIAKVEFSKDGHEGDEIVSRLQVIEVGVDDNGQTITSCIVEPVEGPYPAQKPMQQLNDRQKIARDALIAILATGGMPLPSGFGLPADLQGVPIKQWRNELYARHALDNDHSNPRADFTRLKNQMQARNLIGVRDEWVWLVHSS